MTYDAIIIGAGPGRLLRCDHAGAARPGRRHHRTRPNFRAARCAANSSRRPILPCSTGWASAMHGEPRPGRRSAASAFSAATSAPKHACRRRAVSAAHSAATYWTGCCSMRRARPAPKSCSHGAPSASSERASFRPSQSRRKAKRRCCTRRSSSRRMARGSRASCPANSTRSTIRRTCLASRRISRDRRLPPI